MTDGQQTVDASGRTAEQSSRRSGLIAGVAAYTIWGVLPLYFLAMRPAGPFEIVALRIVFALVFCALLLTVTRAWPRFLGLARQPKVLFTMGLAGALIFVNWQTYVIGTLGGHVVETSLGYFINPIVTVFLGVFFLGERLRPAQWTAVGLSFVAVVVLTVGYGAVPWISLILAFSFGFYGYIKKRVGGQVDAVSGLTLETAWLVPIAVVELIVVNSMSGLVFGTAGVGNTVILLSAGVVTAIPLLLFATAASRLPLSIVGFLQYFAPILQFIIGITVAGEEMPPERWIGFGIVWLALIVLSVDAIRVGRSRRLVVETP
ncbi:EamA family transporter RarD [Naasia lichenicola]|uniref:EamA family transporter RarD n=1 Tax=Naasia lichenicola TaxID=2565933 RepID=A0A4S4FKE6_9MICO|nr:EamA family transporter RarD [Naasia lichenicola]THG29755.1 EamA family transporter RarD [Naasia lichenicola]